MNYDMKKE